jgi:hypothetical protein
LKRILAFWIEQLAFVEQQSAQIAAADQKIVRECRSMFAHKQHLDTALFEYDVRALFNPFLDCSPVYKL